MAVLRVQSSDSAVALGERFVGFLAAEPEFAEREQLNDNVLRIELALSVFVYELGPFIAEPSRGAPLAGTVSYEGTALGLRHGQVRREADPGTGTSRLVYEACFQRRGASQPLRLRLERKLPGAGPARLEEVTVLQATVYDGMAPAAPVAARGSLETSVEDLTASCRLLHAMEPASPQQSARAIVQLGRFLFGDLYDAYTGRPWWKVW